MGHGRLPWPTRPCVSLFGHIIGPVLATWEILSYTDALFHWGHSQPNDPNLIDDDDGSDGHLLVRTKALN